MRVIDPPRGIPPSSYQTRDFFVHIFHILFVHSVRGITPRRKWLLRDHAVVRAPGWHFGGDRFSLRHPETEDRTARTSDDMLGDAARAGARFETLLTRSAVGAHDDEVMLTDGGNLEDHQCGISPLQ